MKGGREEDRGRERESERKVVCKTEGERNDEIEGKKERDREALKEEIRGLDRGRER